MTRSFGLTLRGELTQICTSDSLISLCSIKTDLEPLAIAQNVTQGTGTRLDHVLVTLGNLFQVYSGDAYEAAVRDAVHSSLEKRWSKADQDAFIAATFLNPLIRDELFNSDKLSTFQLYGILKRLYKRFFGTEPPTKMYSAFTSYRLGKDEFSDESTCIAEQKEYAQTQVRRSLSSVHPLS